MNKSLIAILCMVAISSCTKVTQSNCKDPMNSFNKASAELKSGKGLFEVVTSFIKNFDTSTLSKENIECSVSGAIEDNRELIDSISEKTKNSEILKLGKENLIKAIEGQIKIDQELSSYLAALTALYQAAKKDLFPHAKERIISLYEKIQKEIAVKDEKKTLQELKTEIPLIIKDIKTHQI